LGHVPLQGLIISEPAIACRFRIIDAALAVVTARNNFMQAQGTLSTTQRCMPMHRSLLEPDLRQAHAGGTEVATRDWLAMGAAMVSAADMSAALLTA
jgi:hypothetical protein